MHAQNVTNDTPDSMIKEHLAKRDSMINLIYKRMDEVRNRVKIDTDSSSTQIYSRGSGNEIWINGKRWESESGEESLLIDQKDQNGNEVQVAQRGNNNTIIIRQSDSKDKDK